MFTNGQQVRFDPLDYEDQGMSREDARKAALADRELCVRENSRKYPDYKFQRWTLTGQLRQYRSMGVPDGRVRSVFYITIHFSA